MWVHDEVNEFVEGDHHRGLRSTTPPHPPGHRRSAYGPTVRVPHDVWILEGGTLFYSTVVRSKPVAISVSSAAAAACRGVLRLG